jgi:hypothetical protein
VLLGTRSRLRAGNRCQLEEILATPTLPSTALASSRCELGPATTEAADERGSDGMDKDSKVAERRMTARAWTRLAKRCPSGTSTRRSGLGDTRPSLISTSITWTVGLLVADADGVPLVDPLGEVVQVGCHLVDLDTPTSQPPIMY